MDHRSFVKDSPSSSRNVVPPGTPKRPAGVPEGSVVAKKSCDAGMLVATERGMFGRPRTSTSGASAALLGFTAMNPSPERELKIIGEDVVGMSNGAPKATG